MSMSDSDTSSQGSEYRNFRQLTRDRLLYEMLRSTKSGDSKSTWKVLVMDRVTVKIMSYACKMADITEEGVSLVEDIYRRRQPLPTMDAIYFMQPTKENVIMFLSDMTGRAPLYKKAFVFFSSPVPRELVSHIKKDGSVLARIAPNINDNHRTISSLVRQLDIHRALDYDGIPGVIGTGLGRAAHILLNYHPTSTPAGRATTSGSPSTGLLADARRKWSHQDAFGGEDNEDQLSLRKFQELNAAFARTPAPLQASQLASSSSSSPVVWALAFLRGNRPVSVEDSAGSLETAIALAYGLLLPPDMIKEKESSLDRLERTAVLHGIRDKRKEADANFTKAKEELGKAKENVRIFEENMSEAFNNGFDDASRQFEDQVPGVIRKIWAKCWAYCLGQAGVQEDLPLWAQDRVPEGLDLTITKTEISDDEARPSAPVVLPSTSVIPGQQEVGSSSAVDAAADRSGPTHPPAPIDPFVQGQPHLPILLFLLLTLTKR
ncbi:hypothetical protein RHGRI_030971 [Rhododendron griersonianum]|uniref:Uncharacterized protein n=1 Tax=Rhododendron griersonianum TaxID=479676 RepID=A0AAV6I8P1_9ERIC|nr:hypothetical protein RHGRI_030971 [Rhododendron griersonianum]